MRIEAKTPIKHLATSGKHYDLAVGDTANLTGEDENDARMMVHNGWAKNLDSGEDYEPSATPVTLKVQNTAGDQASK